jgi:hypothetical protein
MSYRCQECNKQHFGPANRVVTKIRQKPVPPGGTEIAEEKLLCTVCAKGVGPPEVLPAPPQPPTYHERSYDRSDRRDRDDRPRRPRRQYTKVESR